MIHNVNTRGVRPPPPRMGRTLTKELLRLAVSAGALDPSLVEAWPELVGPDLAQYCRPVRLVRTGRAEMLVVAAQNGAVAMRLQYQREALLRGVQTYARRVNRIQIEQRGGTSFDAAPPQPPARPASMAAPPALPASLPVAGPAQGPSRTARALAQLRQAMLGRP